MKSIVIAVAAAAALTACGGALTADEARSALPQSSQARIGAPDTSSQALTAGTAASAQTAAPLAAGNVTAPLAAATMDLAAAVNGGIVWTLGIVQAVVALPPTRCEGDTCTWGPGSGAFDVNDWKLTVTKQGDHYAWSLAGQPKSNVAAGFIAFLSGNAWPDGRPHVGHGDLVLDLDAAAGLDRRTTDPAPQPGKIEATYDNRTSPTLAVRFLGTADQNAPSQRVNTAYAYAESATGGDLQVASRNTSTNDLFTLHSRWTATGVGRADAAWDGATATYAQSECWDSNATQFNLVYQASSPAQPSDTGLESACAFAPAVPPTLTAP